MYQMGPNYLLPPNSAISVEQNKSELRLGDGFLQPVFKTLGDGDLTLPYAR